MNILIQESSEKWVSKATFSKCQVPGGQNWQVAFEERETTTTATTTTTTTTTTFIYTTKNKVKVTHQIEPYKYGISCL